MPKLTGFFDSFPKLDQVTVEGVAVWLGRRTDAKILDNKLGNRILYPLAVPYSAEDSVFDLAILREAVKIHSQDYYNRNLKLIYIPEEFLQHFPDLHKLVWAFADALVLSEVTSILLKSETLGLKNLGTIIKPKIELSTGVILIWIRDKKYEVKVGSLTVIPVESSKVDIKFQSRAAKLQGGDGVTMEVAGGKLGLVIDARK